jgi:hypothetical protein
MVVVVVVMASLHKISLGEDGMAREREKERVFGATTAKRDDVER